MRSGLRLRLADLQIFSRVRAPDLVFCPGQFFATSDHVEDDTADAFQNKATWGTIPVGEPLVDGPS